MPDETKSEMHTANNVSNPPQNFSQLLREMQDMKNTIKNLTLTNQQSKKEQKDVNPTNGLPWKRYCWSCGCCAHWGRNCPNKKNGHKNQATFKNRMNGSNKNCL